MSTTPESSRTCISIRVNVGRAACQRPVQTPLGIDQQSPRVFIAASQLVPLGGLASNLGEVHDLTFEPRYADLCCLTEPVEPGGPIKNVRGTKGDIKPEV